ncbi:MAG TPA: sigma-54 dependent transcriptional regulator [Bacillota bacterium]|jgi:two-component system response regulator HydG|nr:sigma-54-dependent Fis family transcriptional regulator [Clostridiales bacterium UBA9856]HOA42507.1 sigma-54 dependent transcriptional regulator [Bacillota bacterium]HPZ59129.1 sigma-54 dependent transcriptional regulator [Bacillota bacterium]HQC82547.1 sigma-54 dependent transcriptional regulator [Bacillota bacterium]
MNKRGLRILVVDDEPDYCNVMKVILEANGHMVTCDTSGQAALATLAKKSFDLVITDLMMPEIDGRQLMAEIKERYPGVEVIILTAYGSIENAVDAMREGAYSYVTKGGDPGELLREISKLREMLDLKQENLLLKAKMNQYEAMLETKSPLFQSVLATAKKAANSDSNILLLGESGVGKEIIARYIHENSPRADKTFMDLNCHAIAATVLESELFGHEKGSFTGAMTRRIGRIEAADSGTLFLDEIGDIPLSMQAKLLKAIETKRIYRMGSNEEIEVDFRLVSATNKNLAEEIAAERFREDFYYRISTIVIRIPPLRERKEDLPLLIDYFFKKSQNEMKKTINHIEPEVMDALLSYHYPGNIRELKNIIERIVVLSEDGVIQMDSFPAPLPAAGNDVKSMVPLAEEKSLREMRKEAETIYIENILKKYNYDMNKSAEVLGITRRQLLNKITEYGISRSEN